MMVSVPRSSPQPLRNGDSATHQTVYPKCAAPADDEPRATWFVPTLTLFLFAPIAMPVSADVLALVGFLVESMLYGASALVCASQDFQ